MSIFSRFFGFPPSSPLPASGIRSATGLPRSAIAAYYRHAGLFGRDSDLSGIEQFVVRSRLGSLPGVPMPKGDASAARVAEPTLRLLSEHVDALVAGRESRENVALLRTWGFTDAALSEIERTVHNVQDIFGPRARPSKADVRETVMAPPSIARAA